MAAQASLKKERRCNRAWINTTPAGRMGFYNYRSLREFCALMGIEVPTKRKKMDKRGRIETHYDWAALEAQRGAEIAKAWRKHKSQYITVATMAAVIGTSTGVVRNALTDIGYPKTGGRYLIPRADGPRIFNRIAAIVESHYQTRRRMHKY